jgi:hypothetical protein
MANKGYTSNVKKKAFVQKAYQPIYNQRKKKKPKTKKPKKG